MSLDRERTAVYVESYNKPGKAGTFLASSHSTVRMCLCRPPKRS